MSNEAKLSRQEIEYNRYVDFEKRKKEGRLTEKEKEFLQKQREELDRAIEELLNSRGRTLEHYCGFEVNDDGDVVIYGKDCLDNADYQRNIFKNNKCERCNKMVADYLSKNIHNIDLTGDNRVLAGTRKISFCIKIFNFFKKLI